MWRHLDLSEYRTMVHADNFNIAWRDPAGQWSSDATCTYRHIGIRTYVRFMSFRIEAAGPLIGVQEASVSAILGI